MEVVDNQVLLVVAATEMLETVVRCSLLMGFVSDGERVRIINIM